MRIYMLFLHNIVYICVNNIWVLHRFNGIIQYYVLNFGKPNFRKYPTDRLIKFITRRLGTELDGSKRFLNEKKIYHLYLLAEWE
ncbi:hypothetical protein C922_05059 [Plasmodium inui San Antonio 1]|uniref:Uncharacterized protein n=1 Tax=Plasmodium inui San Antonio 1 TaxID=1237626 RepID=W6ZZ02_9APIC|nr:hypothetical protein C922_05059 [Plasmodium inui San Antonio 1]EUD64543.1 hypothetical protein C922_05059 [Plasmodium inui San Antonio 1]